jgi:hypothetical protein
MKVGRNDPCPCGSGERYKNCHMGKDGTMSNRSNLTLLLVGGAVAIALVAGAVLMKGPRTTPSATGSPMATGGGAVGGGPGTPQPPGPAPAGKVWSPEHGHWHDAPVGAMPGAVSSPVTVTPGGASSPVTITPGATPTATPGATPTPQPPGPAPAGKVWSPEHGHWHDAPPGGGQ